MFNCLFYVTKYSGPGTDTSGTANGTNIALIQAVPCGDVEHRARRDTLRRLPRRFDMRNAYRGEGRAGARVPRRLESQFLCRVI